MPIFESKGLLQGRRLRKLTPIAHALWPFIFSLASKRYGRLEIDCQLITQQLGHLNLLLKPWGVKDAVGETVSSI